MRLSPIPSMPPAADAPAPVAPEPEPAPAFHDLMARGQGARTDARSSARDPAAPEPETETCAMEKATEPELAEMLASAPLTDLPVAMADPAQARTGETNPPVEDPDLSVPVPEAEASLVAVVTPPTARQVPEVPAPPGTAAQPMLPPAHAAVPAAASPDAPARGMDGIDVPAVDAGTAAIAEREATPPPDGSDPGHGDSGQGGQGPGRAADRAPPLAQAAAEPFRPPTMREVAIAVAASPDQGVEIDLGSDGLGAVRLRLVTAENSVVVQIVAERPETLDFLRRQSGDLAQELRQMGFDDVSFGFADQQGDGPPRDDLRTVTVAVAVEAAFANMPAPSVSGAGLDLRL